LGRERGLLVGGARCVAGVDEVGRGALAGPVAVGVVIVDRATAEPPEGLADSKMLSARRREELVPLIETWCVAGAVGWTEAREIDEVGIVAALGIAASRALARLSTPPPTVILDGNHDWLSPAIAAFGPDVASVETIVGADGACASVSAASVLAKVARDRLMVDLDASLPGYGWSANKGYGSRTHREAIVRLGPTEHHRHSWRLV
jgi:ribonuclease HII